MISVLCPSRNRHGMLIESVNSLLTTADQPDKLDICIAADPDDTATQWIGNQYGQLWVPDRRLGYYYFHEYVNHLAKLAQGDWMLLWNDDAIMDSKGWDTHVARHPGYVIQTLAHGRGTLFPAVPAEWVRHVGHFALERHCDSWWHEVGRQLGRMKSLKLAGSHHNPDDRTSDEARGKKKNPEFYGPDNMALIKADVAKIKEIL